MMLKASKLGVLVVGAAALAGCSKKKAPTTPKNEIGMEVPKVDPTLCETVGKNVVTYDLNHDNRPDVWRLYRTEDEGGTKIEFMTCKQVDFDHDGRKDWVVGYNRKGNPLFEKADFDYDGKFDMSAVFDPKTAKVAEVERDIDRNGSFDVKEIYDTSGTLQSIRKDRNGDSIPDEWEQYKENILIAILYDDDFDGKVDRRDEIPGATPKVEMPTTMDTSQASGAISPDKAAPPSSSAPGNTPKKK
ncbi:MAG TPA: hypothetical protein VMZ53_28060 [Kofleriaceae bacterium]|nr:hypothetical protein [Kofleriaceae bacterium]